MQAELFIPMKVVGKARPRYGNGDVYTEDKTVKAEESISDAWRMRYPKWELLDEPVNVAMQVYKVAPKSRIKQVGKPWAVKPDIDNIIKLVLDALNGVCWKDDAKVIRVWAEKTAWVKDVEQEGILIAITTEEEVEC